MYRVKGLKASNGQNILLLCGTEVINDKGILKEGFKPSQTGRNGLEFYSNNSVTVASKYGKCFVGDIWVLKSMVYIFIIKLNISSSSLTKDFKHKQDKVNK